MERVLGPLGVWKAADRIWSWKRRSAPGASATVTPSRAARVRGQSPHPAGMKAVFRELMWKSSSEDELLCPWDFPVEVHG